jgi:ribosomal protein L37E
MISRQIRCKKCNHWNLLTEENASCESCGFPLIEISEAEAASIERRKTAGELMLKIMDNDAWYVVFYKRVYNAVTLVFLSIIGFFVWLFVTSPG